MSDGRESIMRFWPVAAFVISSALAGVAAWYDVKNISVANAENIRELKDRVKENEFKASELLRGDDKLKATIELEATKLRAEIDKASREQNQQLDSQNQQLNTILRLLQARP